MGLLLEERMSVKELDQKQAEPLQLPCRVVLDPVNDQVCRLTGWTQWRGAYRTELCPEHRRELDAKYIHRPYYTGHLIWDISCPGADVDAPSCPHGDAELSDPYVPGGCWGWYLTGRKPR